MSRYILLVSLGVMAVACLHVAVASAGQDPSACQAPGWNTKSELTLFGGKAAEAGAGSSMGTAPVLELDHLYHLKLNRLQDVHLSHVPANGKSFAGSRAGLVRFSVPTRGVYRITVDARVWIDVISPKEVLEPVSFHGWHACRLFRKSLQYALDGKQALVLQITDAQVDDVKIVIRAL
jgi:hypothetical protein